MDNFSLFDYFGLANPVQKENEEPPKKEKKEKKDAKKTSRKVKKNEPVLAGPLTFIGRGFKKVLGTDSTTSKPLSVWLEELYQEGIMEAAVEACKCVVIDSTVYLLTPDKPSLEDMAIMADQFDIVDGQMKATFTLDEDFPSYTKDELSVVDVIEKLDSLGNPALSECSIFYDSKAKVGLPIYEKLTEQSLALPVHLLTFGEVISYEPAAFLGKTSIEPSELDSFVVPNSDIEVTYQKRKDGVIVPCFKAGKNVTVYEPARDSMQKDTDASANTRAVERYALPASIYLVQYGIKIPVTNEQFENKDKVTEEEIINYLKQDFPLFRSSERKIDVIYDRANNVISVAALSGKKGYRRHRYAGRKRYSEEAHTGMFKLIRTKEELDEVCKKDCYFGNYVGEPGENVTRLENFPIGIFTLQYGTHRTVKGVGFKPKVRKVPYSIMKEILAYFKQDLSKEAIVQIWYNRKEDIFEVRYPSFVYSTKEQIDYEFISHETSCVLYMTIHSHNTFEARFSITDDEDEVATGLYGVIGTLDIEPTFRFRAGIMGCFKELPMEELFETEAMKYQYN